MKPPQYQRIGGLAGLLAAATFVFGFALFATLFADYTTGDPSPAESVEFLVHNQAALYVWNLVILLVFGIVLVPLVLALHERVKPGAPVLGAVAAALGIIWTGLVLAAGMIANIGVGTVADLHGSDPAQAESVWSALDAVQNGLGGGNEIAGGLWVLLVSAAALRTQALPRWLSYLGVLAGIAGLVTVVPALEVAGAVFGLGLIVWFAWAGAVMLRSDRRRGNRSREEEADDGARTHDLRHGKATL
jgi:prepilin signal peptidase PulO-like enzyme (type II secretory pathway)